MAKKVIAIEGGHTLSGTVRISGAKNATVALIPAIVLAEGPVEISGVPEISDVDALGVLLRELNCEVSFANETLEVDPTNIKNIPLVSEAVEKLRASYYFMGALLGRYKDVMIKMPGGCYLGPRPIDLHLKGFEALGATIDYDEESGCYHLYADELIGTEIYLDFASVGATINIMLAAVRAKGVTTIDNAAKEPEIVNVATFLNNMGAKITGAGTSTIKIVGVDHLHKCFHEVIPDRIEAGTYIIIGALCGTPLKIDNVIPEHLDSLLSKLEEMGINLEIGADYVTVLDSSTKLKATNIKTAVYPGFPTDLQQPFTVLLTQAHGKSKVTETIWENRFMHIPYLKDLGADIEVKNQTATVLGPKELKGCEVVATDLRAGAAMVAAGLIAEGKTTIANAEHILRGYEQIVEKLSSVGAKIKIKEI